MQDPSDAAVSAMPQNALNAVKVDYKVPVSEMAGLLTRLADDVVPDDVGNGQGNKDKRVRGMWSVT